MRVLFMGSGEFGVPTLAALAGAHEVVAVISQPDKPAGRSRATTPTPAAAWALANGLELVREGNVNTPGFIARVAALRCEAAVVVAFGQKLSPELIASLGARVVNLHASLLPRHRGAAPINWAMIEGDERTGVCVIALAQRMDAGEVYASVATPIDPLETAGELHDRLAGLGAPAVLDVLARHARGELRGEAQDESLATRAPKLSRADGWVDFNAGAAAVRSRIHGLTPWPGVTVRWLRAGAGEARPLLIRRVEAFPELRADAPPGTLLADHWVATGRGAVRLIEVQAPGGKAMAIADFARGNRMEPGDRLQGGPAIPSDPAG